MGSKVVVEARNKVLADNKASDSILACSILVCSKVSDSILVCMVVGSILACSKAEEDKVVGRVSDSKVVEACSKVVVVGRALDSKVVEVHSKVVEDNKDLHNSYCYQRLIEKTLPLIKRPLMQLVFFS